MTLELGLPRSFARFAAIALVAVGASACSSVPHWVDPTTWMGGDDQSANADAGQSNAPTPDLAAIPDKPVAPSTVDERKQVADSLKADRADAQYSADALRGGTEPSAPPPPPASPSAPASADQTAAASPPAADTASPPATAATADSASQQTAAAAAAPASGSTAAADAASPTPEATAAAQPAAAATPAPAAQVATASPPPDATPPVAPASDDQLGFQPSKAPPLDPSVAHFVAPDVLNQYQQTTTDSATTTAPTLTPPAPPKADPAQTSSSLDAPISSHVRSASASAPATGAAATPSSYSGMVSPAAYSPGQQTQPAAIVFFPRDAAVLSAKAKAQILSAAQSFQSRDGTGFIRVVGHSSSRTADMPMARHLAVVFEHSQDFATAVAHELIRDGVPADKVLIEAVGDSQPVYYESMPQGEAGNRRAEIFL
jgi:outer membrane protein OmpA-like peptidoglycan-associated protein